MKRLVAVIVVVVLLNSFANAGELVRIIDTKTTDLMKNVWTKTGSDSLPSDSLEQACNFESQVFLCSVTRDSSLIFIIFNDSTTVERNECGTPLDYHLWFTSASCDYLEDLFPTALNKCFTICFLKNRDADLIAVWYADKWSFIFEDLLIKTEKTED